jgi:hypothetical protein
MNSLSLFSTLVLGFGLGLKHAIEADHLAAVSTIVTQRKNLATAAIVGGLWGVGHTVSLLIAGTLVIVFQIEIGGRLEQGLEFCVAMMLIILGADALRRLLSGGQVHVHEHEHSGYVHVHPHVHEHETTHSLTRIPRHSHFGTIGLRPVVVGMVHGFAGSGALMLLVLTTISSPSTGIFYILVFGVGSIGGMVVMSLLMGLPMQLTATRFHAAHLIMGLAAGIFSVVFGIYMVYDIGWVGGLLRT